MAQLRTLTLGTRVENQTVPPCLVGTVISKAPYGYKEFVIVLWDNGQLSLEQAIDVTKIWPCFCGDATKHGVHAAQDHGDWPY